MVSTYFKNLLSDHIWHTAATKELPTNYYVALSATQPLEDGTGVKEPKAASGYARVAMSDIGAAANGVVSNTAPISWPKVTSNEGEVGYWAIFDEPTGGNLLMGNAFESVKHLDSGTTITVDPSGLTLRVLGE